MFSGGIKIGARNKATVKCCGKTLNLNLKVIAFTVIDPLKKGVQKIDPGFFLRYFFWDSQRTNESQSDCQPFQA